MRSSVSIKTWQFETPSVDAVRPARCPVCGAPSRPLGGALCLWGHGLVWRQVRGDLGDDGSAPSETRAVACRRYVCQSPSCGAVIIVAPAEVLPRRRYLATAIALALFLWAKAGSAQGVVFAEVTGLPPDRLDLPDRWRTLTAWGRAALDGRLFGHRPEPGARSAIRRSAVIPVITRLIGAAPPASREAPERIRLLEGARHAM